MPRLPTAVLSTGLMLLVLGATGVIGWMARVVPRSAVLGLQVGLGLAMAWLGAKLLGTGPLAGGVALAHTRLAIIDLATAVYFDQSSWPQDFDPETWLAEWIRRPQPALDGRTPAELLEDEDGFRSVRRVFGAMWSGAYQ